MHARPSTPFQAPQKERMKGERMGRKEGERRREENERELTYFLF